MEDRMSIRSRAASMMRFARAGARCADSFTLLGATWRAMAMVAFFIGIPAQAGVDRWTSIGPDAGYAISGTYGVGGLFKTIDAGARWWRVDQPPGVDPFDLQVDGGDPELLYARGSADGQFGVVR